MLRMWCVVCCSRLVANSCVSDPECDECTPCIGWDGYEDCCTPEQTCHTEPCKGNPCE
jgi:hypothetical protein